MRLFLILAFPLLELVSQEKFRHTLKIGLTVQAVNAVLLKRLDALPSVNLDTLPSVCVPDRSLLVSVSIEGNLLSVRKNTLLHMGYP